MEGPGPRFLAALVLLAVLIACGGRAADDMDNRPATPAPAMRELSAGHRKMLETLREIRDRAREDNAYVGEAKARGLRRELAELPASAPPAQRLDILYRLGEAELWLGHERDAIARYREADELLGEAAASLKPEGSAQLKYNLAVAFLRLGESENCVIDGNPESCILPIRGRGIHERQEGARMAIRHLTEALNASPQSSTLHMNALWLLNLAYMTVGEYPDAVPRRYLIPPAVLEPEADLPRFENVAPRLGLDTFSLAGGAVADDLDGDGDLDLMVSTADPGGQLRYFENSGGAEGRVTFRDRTEAAGLTGLYGGLNLVHADYDNDGDVDVLVLRGAWNFLDGRHPNSLLANNGDATFTDVTFESGLGEVHYPTQTAAWADYDNDGRLDLYVGNESFGDVFFPSQLFHNDGTGADGRVTFTDVAEAAGVENDNFAKAVVWGDYDGDARPDLYVSNYMGFNRLYHNDGAGADGRVTFTDTARELGVIGPVESFPAWFWDFDNDGHLDLYVSNYTAKPADVATSYLGLPLDKVRLLPQLYRGDGRGVFSDVAEKSGLSRPAAPMGSNFGDLDNDGYLDFYLGTGWPNYDALMPNVMYLNRRGESFADVTMASGMGHLQKGHAVVFADFDHDGDQDVFEQMGGFYRGDEFADALYENPGFGNHWVKVKLAGTRSNRSAIGARIRLDVDDGGERRTIYRFVGSGGSFGGNPLRQEIGLGQATVIDRLEVFWPASGETQTFSSVAVDRLLEIVEGEDEYEAVELRPLGLGGS